MAPLRRLSRNTTCCAIIALAAFWGTLTGRVAGAQAHPLAAWRALRCARDRATSDVLGTRRGGNGFSLRLERRQNRTITCRATLYDSRGRVAWQADAFSILVDSATGWDVDGDSQPDLVLSIDPGGGEHCCTQTEVIALTRVAHSLLKRPWIEAAEFRQDRGRQVTLWSWQPFPGEFGPNGANVWAQRVYAFRNHGFVDVTDRYCDAILADPDITRPLPDADAIRRLATFGAAHDSAYGVADQIRQRMVQEVFCGRLDRALYVARTTWPEAPDRAEFLKDFARTIVAAYPRYAEQLRDWR